LNSGHIVVPRGQVVPRKLSALPALRLVIARLRSRSGGHEEVSGERALHIAGVTLVEDRGRNRPQADLTVLIPTRLLVRPELISIH